MVAALFPLVCCPVQVFLIVWMSFGFHLHPRRRAKILVLVRSPHRPNWLHSDAVLFTKFSKRIQLVLRKAITFRVFVLSESVSLKSFVKTELAI